MSKGPNPLSLSVQSPIFQHLDAYTHIKMHHFVSKVGKTLISRVQIKEINALDTRRTTSRQPRLNYLNIKIKQLLLYCVKMFYIIIRDRKIIFQGGKSDMIKQVSM